MSSVWNQAIQEEGEEEEIFLLGLPDVKYEGTTNLQNAKHTNSTVQHPTRIFSNTAVRT